MNVMIIGAGYVGLTTAIAFATYEHQVTVLENNERKITALLSGKAPFYEADLVLELQKCSAKINYVSTSEAIKDHDLFFVCVATPQLASGAADTSQVLGVIEEIARKRMMKKGRFIIVIKSTVPHDFPQKATVLLKSLKADGEIAVNPEFLSQGQAINDALHPTRIVCGVVSEHTKRLLGELFAGFNAPILFMSLASAVLAKYAANSFQALKISFANEIANFAEKTGADARKVLESVGYDPVIGPQFLRYGIGFGGSCFPKDTAALAFQAKTAKVEMKILRALIRTNDAQLTRLASEVLKRSHKERIGLLGLSFKPGTDDVRETPAHYIVELLNKVNVRPLVYDPQGSANYLQSFKRDQVTVVNSAKELIAKVDNVLLVTEWDEFKSLRAEDFIGKRVYDGRAIYSFAYFQIGRGYEKFEK